MSSMFIDKAVKRRVSIRMPFREPQFGVMGYG
jgi:hypothetical protein